MIQQKNQLLSSRSKKKLLIIKPEGNKRAKHKRMAKKRAFNCESMNEKSDDESSIITHFARSSSSSFYGGGRNKNKNSLCVCLSNTLRTIKMGFLCHIFFCNSATSQSQFQIQRLFILTFTASSEINIYLIEMISLFSFIFILWLTSSHLSSFILSR